MNEQDKVEVKSDKPWEVVNWTCWLDLAEGKSRMQTQMAKSSILSVMIKMCGKTAQLHRELQLQRQGNSF